MMIIFRSLFENTRFQGLSNTIRALFVDQRKAFAVPFLSAFHIIFTTLNDFKDNQWIDKIKNKFKQEGALYEHGTALFKAFNGIVTKDDPSQKAISCLYKRVQTIFSIISNDSVCIPDWEE